MMFKEKPKPRIHAFALAAAFALALSGCGGGGGGAGPGVTPDSPLVAAQKAAAAAADNAELAYQVAMAAVAAIEVIKDADTASYDEAVAAAARARAAWESAASLSRMAAGTDSVAEAQIYAAQAQLRQIDAAAALVDVRKYAGMVTAARNAADAEAARLAGNAEATTKITAINAEAVRTGGNDLTRGGAPAGVAIAISHEGGAQMVEVSTGTGPAKVVWERAGDGTHVFADEASGVTQVVSVTTDIMAPAPTAFGEVHALDVREDGAAATEQMPNDALNIGAGHLGMIKADAFKAPAGLVGAATLSFQQAVADLVGTPEDESMAAAAIAGTFDGAAGIYKCNAAGSPCTITVDAEGVVSGVSNNDDWIFIPAAGETIDVEDTNYTWYGFWVRKTVKDGVTTYNAVETFAGANPEAVANLDNVAEGSATYRGGASGVYGHKTFRRDGTLDVISAGTFLADVTLNAYFGDQSPAVPASLHNSISGEVTNFRLSGGETPGWRVDLEQTAVGATFSGDATGVGTGLPAEWNGAFRGAGRDLDGDGPGTDIGPPGIAVGEFNAHFTNGHLAGAFGAKLVGGE